MNPVMVLKTALFSFGANRLRAGLTLLGIVIGVASVISMVAVGRGAQAAVTEQIQNLGTNLLFIRPGGSAIGLFFRGFGSGEFLTLDDAVALDDARYAPDVGLIAPEISFGGQMVAGQNNTSAPGLGVTSEYIAVRNFEIESGRNISPADVINRTEVVVLGSRIAETLFGARDPVGAPMRIDGREFTVVGVLKSKGDTGFGFEDDRVLAPITTAHYRLTRSQSSAGDITVTNINAQAVSDEAMDAAASQIETLLRLRHEIGPTDESDFTVTNQAETIETLEGTQQTFVILLGSIAGISLLVGGIGIMNIMLVSVTERTREIGIRRAVGAKRRDILFQFISEATLLSLGGGLIGIIAGMGIAAAVDGRSIGEDQLNTVLSADVAVLAIGVSAAIGLFFGIFPAVRASRLDPIEALRYQ